MKDLCLSLGTGCRDTHGVLAGVRRLRKVVQAHSVRRYTVKINDNIISICDFFAMNTQESQQSDWGYDSPNIADCWDTGGMRKEK